MRPFQLALSVFLAAGAPALWGAAQAATPPTAIHFYKPGRVPAVVSTAVPTMRYYGGPVISKVKVEVVFWTGGVAAATKAGIGGFLGALANSTFTDQLAQYGTSLTGVNGKPGTNQTIGRGSVVGSVTITPQDTSLKLTDAAVKKELRHQITIGKLPQQDPNTLYMIYFPANVTISLGGAVSCQAFGAYHEAGPGQVGAANLFYGVMPDCGGGFAEQTVVSSHEFAEAVSDAIPTPGSHPAYPQAWNDVHGDEIGDLCEGTSAKLTAGKASYTVQEVFSNKTNACATGNFTSP
jgi:hypothetical protein